MIAGPTASGKTSVGIRLAQRLGGEIISADSRQIYRYMDVGTAKPTPAERAATPHHLIDIVDPDTPYNASDFAQAAGVLIEEILGRGCQPIIVGGAGFYLEALFDGLSPIPSSSDELKSAVYERVRSDAGSAYKELQSVDPETAANLIVSDRQRIARALEVYESTGKPISHFQTRPRVPATTRKAIQFGLSWNRTRLYDRINRRVETMIEEGLVDELRKLFKRGYHRNTYALKTFGYREIGAYLDGEISLEEAVATIQTGSRHYAKRQLTWFRNRSSLRWLDAEASDPVVAILEAIEKS